MGKLCILIFGMFFMHTACAAEVTINKGFYRTSYETVTLPNDEKMGLIAIDYLLGSDMGFYYGLGGYGALSGERGGFFTGGLELGYQRTLFNNISLDLGLFGGGGGGGSAPQGGGLMLRPHAGLLYDAFSWRAGLSYSLVLFPNGDIGSDQIALQLEIPFETVSADTKASPFLYRSLQRYADAYDFGWIDRYFAATLQRYFPAGGTRDTSGQADLENITLIGFEYGSYIDKHWFGFLETAGAMAGGAGGYAEVLGGLGYDHAFNEKSGIKAKLSLGSGGGGQVDTGGGFISKAAAAAYYKPFRPLTVNAEAGYIAAPDGSFNARSAKLSLAYDLTFLGIGDDLRHIDAYEAITTGEWELRIVNQAYLPSDTILSNGKEGAVELIGLKIDRYIDESFYMTGQAYGAYSGGVGGYASGLVGLGYRTPRFFEKISFYGELLGGAGAGGGVVTDGGSVIQPMAGAGYAISKALDLQVGIGRIVALRGHLDTTVADIGVGYRFGTIEKR